MVSVAIIQTGLNEFLMTSRKDNRNDFGLIGGKAEGDESPFECLKREVKEETGLEVIHATLIDTREYEGQETYCYYIDSFKHLGKISDVVSRFNDENPSEGTLKLGTLEDLCSEGSSYQEYNLEITDIALGNLFDKTFYQVNEFETHSEKIEFLFESFQNGIDKQNFVNVNTGLGEVTYVEYLFNKVKTDLIAPKGV